MYQETLTLSNMEREVEEAITESHQTIVDTDQIVSASKEQMQGLVLSPLMSNKGGNKSPSNRSFEAFVCVDINGSRTIITASVKEYISCLTTFRQELEKILKKENPDFPGLDTATYWDPIVRKWLVLEEGVMLPHKVQIFCTPRDRVVDDEVNLSSKLSLGTPLPNLQATSTTLGGPSVKLASPMYRLNGMRTASVSDELISTLNTAEMRTPSPESRFRNQNHHLVSLTDGFGYSELHEPAVDIHHEIGPVDALTTSSPLMRSESPVCDEDKIRIEYYLSVIERQRSHILDLEGTVRDLKNKNQLLTVGNKTTDISSPLATISLSDQKTPEILKQASPIQAIPATPVVKPELVPKPLYCRLRIQNTRNVSSVVPFLYKKRVLTIENWSNVVPKIIMNYTKDGLLHPLETITPIRFATFTSDRMSVNCSFLISTSVSTRVFIADDVSVFGSWLDWATSAENISSIPCSGILPSPEVGYVPSPH